MRRLNLGCGRFPLPGYENVDWDPKSGADFTHDLNVFPYPFADAQFDEVRMDHVLEHLAEPFKVMGEARRILKPGGTLSIQVPHFSRGFTHPEHQRGFDVTFPFYFDPEFVGGYTGIALVHQKTRLRWCAQPYLKRKILGPVTTTGLLTIGLVLDILAALSPGLCSRFWCFLVGGFEEVSFTFKRPS